MIAEHRVSGDSKSRAVPQGQSVTAPTGPSPIVFRQGRVVTEMGSAGSPAIVRQGSAWATQEYNL